MVMATFYKNTRNEMIPYKNISIELFKIKSPKLRLNPIFKNTNCFTNLNDDVYLMIQVELPFIKIMGISRIKRQRKCIIIIHMKPKEYVCNATLN